VSHKRRKYTREVSEKQWKRLNWMLPKSTATWSTSTVIGAVVGKKPPSGAKDPLTPGLAPFDQPETGALAALIRDIRPGAVLFYHAALEAVYPGRCGDNPDLSLPLAEVYSSGSGYRVAGGGNETGTGGYDVTGSAPAWVNSIGIPSLDVELSTADTTDFERNLRALQAVQRWVASR